MNKQQLLEIIKIGESCEIEFKESKNKLPKSLWETYSAFANTRGGYIILGVIENSKNNECKIDGITNINNILKDSWITMNFFHLLD